jgi:hypothetical protein
MMSLQILELSRLMEKYMLTEGRRLLYKLISPKVCEYGQYRLDPAN